MQFPRIAVFVPAVVIVDAVGDVGGLLDFGNEATFPDGMDGTGRDEKAVSFFHFFSVQYFRQCVVVEFGQVFRLVGVFVETHEQLCIRIGIHDVPHFSFSVCIVAFFSNCIVGMNLDGKIVAGINVFNQQRKFYAELFVYFVSN